MPAPLSPKHQPSLDNAWVDVYDPNSKVNNAFLPCQMMPYKKTKSTIHPS